MTKFMHTWIHDGCDCEYCTKARDMEAAIRRAGGRIQKWTDGVLKLTGTDGELHAFWAYWYRGIALVKHSKPDHWMLVPLRLHAGKLTGVIGPLPAVKRAAAQIAELIDWDEIDTLDKLDDSTLERVDKLLTAAGPPLH